MHFAVNASCPWEAKVSSNEGVVIEEDDIRGRGEFGIWRVHLKRGINVNFFILREMAIYTERP
jgi:hypothetical protein